MNDIGDLIRALWLILPMLVVAFGGGLAYGLWIRRKDKC